MAETAKKRKAKATPKAPKAPSLKKAAAKAAKAAKAAAMETPKDPAPKETPAAIPKEAPAAPLPMKEIVTPVPAKPKEAVVAQPSNDDEVDVDDSGSAIEKPQSNNSSNGKTEAKRKLVEKKNGMHLVYLLAK